MTGYASLEEAVKKANDGDTITVLDDVNLTERLVIEEGKALTLDLNGFTVSPARASVNQVIRVAGNLTVRDSSNGSGKITTDGGNVHSGIAILVTGKKAVLKVESGIIECSAAEACAVKAQLGGSVQVDDGQIVGNGDESQAVFLLGGRIRIDGGRIEACDSECTAIKAMALYYNKEYYPTPVVLNDGEVIGSDWGISVIGIGKENCQTTVEIHGGTVEAQNGAAIAGNGTNDKQKCCAWTNIVITDGVIRGATAMYLPQYGTTRITGGIITGTEAAIEIVSGKLIMTDGTLILDSEDRNLTFDPDRSNGTACRGAALAVVARTKDGEQGYQNGLYWGEMEISISGGEIEGNYTVFEGLSEACSTEASIKKFEITGGKFTGEVRKNSGRYI